MKLLSHVCGSNPTPSASSRQCSLPIVESIIRLPFIYILEVCVIFDLPLHQLFDGWGCCQWEASEGCLEVIPCSKNQAKAS